MDQITEPNNSPNNKINSYDKMRETIFNLVSKKCLNNNNSTSQFSRQQNLLLMSIFDTHEKDLSNVDQKLDTMKVLTSSVRSPSTLFSFSMIAMYNILNCAKKQRLMLKSYIPGINTSSFHRNTVTIPS